MRRFWAKKCRRDHLRSLWRSVVPVTVRRWTRSAAAEGRWEIWPSVGLRSLWRSVLQVRREDQRSDPSTQIPRVEVFWNKDPRRTVVPMTVRHTCHRGEWREQQMKLHKYGTTKSMTVRRDHDGPSWPRRFVMTTTVRHDHDGPSRDPSNQSNFGRFPAIRILV